MPEIIFRPKRALVTGGAGFIGSSLVRILLENDVAVRVLAMPADPCTNLDSVRDRIELVRGDLLDRPSLDAAVVGCDTVFHLVAIYAVWLPVPRRMFDVNVDGTRNVLRAAAEAGVQRIVHTSSIAAVGAHAEERQLADEDCHFNEWDVASDYVLSKYVSELEVHRLVGQEGVPAVIVNPAFPFGWGDIGPTPTGGIVQQLLRGIPVYFPGGFNAVGVHDVAMGHWLAALHGQVGRRYVLGGDNLTYLEFAGKVAQLAGIKPPRFEVGPRVFTMIGRLGDFVADHITHKAPLAAEMTVKYAVGRYLYFDIARARAELGYDPAPIEHHIRHAIAWFRGGINSRGAEPPRFGAEAHAR